MNMQTISGKQRLPQFNYSLLLRLAFILLVGVSLLRKLFDPDIWWHMVVGREVIREMHVPDHVFYILPRMGEPGEFHEWGFGALYYLIEHYTGFLGMAIVNAVIGCGILLCLYCAARSKAETPWWQALPVVVLALWVIEPRLNFRPETLLYLLLAAEILLLEKFLVHRKIAWLLPLPLFAWLLSQAHPSTIFLIGVLGIYALQAVLSSPEKIRTCAIMGTVMLAMAAVSIINPYGLQQLLLPFYTLSNSEIATITEFLPVLQTEYAARFVVMAIIAAVAILFAPPRRPVDVLLFLLFGYLAFRYARNIALLGIAAYLPAHHAWIMLMDRIATSRTRIRILASLAAFIGVAGVVTIAANADWGVGILEQNTPYRNAQLLERVNLRGNILNFYDLGNYLAWKLDRPVFVDGSNYGRNRAVKLHDEIFSADEGWQDLVYGFNIQAIVTPATLDFSGEIIPLVAALENDPDWNLVGREKSGLLFLKSPVPDGIALLPKDMIWRQAIEELNATLALYPDNKQVYQSLATAYGHLGDTARQQYFYGKSAALPN